MLRCVLGRLVINGQLRVAVMSSREQWLKEFCTTRRDRSCTCVEMLNTMHLQELCPLAHER